MKKINATGHSLKAREQRDGSMMDGETMGNKLLKLGFHSTVHRPVREKKRNQSKHLGEKD